MNIEEAKEILKDIDTTDFYNTYSEYTFPDEEIKEKCVAIETVLSELKKKDKVINEMAEWMAGGNSYMYATKEQVIEEFTNKVEREGK